MQNKNKNRKTTKTKTSPRSPKLQVHVDYYEGFTDHTTPSNQNHQNTRHRASKSQPPKMKNSTKIKKSKPKKIKKSKKNTKPHNYKRHKLSKSKPSPPLPPPHLLHTPSRSLDDRDTAPMTKATKKTRLRPKSTSHRNSHKSTQKTRFSIIRSRSMTPSKPKHASPPTAPVQLPTNQQQKASNINLNVRIEQAKGLRKHHIYCITVSIGSRCYTTQKIESSHPKWNESFLFSFEYANYIIITLNEMENTERKTDLDDEGMSNESIMMHFRGIGKYSKLTWLTLNKLDAKLRVKIKLRASAKLDLEKYKTEMNNMLALCRENNLNLTINDVKMRSNQKIHNLDVKSLQQSTTASASLNHSKLAHQSKVRSIEYPVGSEKLLIILENVNIIVNRGIVEVCDVILTSYRLIIRYHAMESQALSFQILFGLILKLKIKQKRVNNKIINPLTGAICETFETRKSEKKLGYKMKYFMHKLTMDGDDIAENIFFRDVLTIRTKTGKCIEIASKFGYKRRTMRKSLNVCCNPNKQSIAIYEMSMKILNTFNKHNILFPISTNFRHMSSYNWCNYVCNDKIFNPLNANDWIYEFEARQKVPANKFRQTKINYKYELCPTYPQIFYVPYSVSDELCVNASNFRSRNRMVILDYYNAVNGNIIARCAQPMRGIMNKSNEYDIKYMNAIRKTVGKNGKLIFFDCRSEAAAQANRFRGKGTEKQEWYGNTKIVFLDIPNIHVMRNSFDELCNIIAQFHSDDVENLLRKIYKSNNKWNKYIFSLIVGGLKISKRVLDNDKNIVSIIHCSDGWDRTSQFCALTQMLIDPYCRTINGFIMIIEKEWLSFGHKFKDRNGFMDKKDERSPIFLQFIECIYHLVNIFANEFEFNIYFLIKVAKYYQTYWFGNFLFNSQRERKQNNMHRVCVNIWSWKNLVEEVNPNYNPKCKFLYITNNQLQNKLKPLFFEYFNLESVHVQTNDNKKKLLNGMSNNSNSSNNCNDCNQQFSLFKKRLECNNCKQIFCNKCVQKIGSNHKDDNKEDNKDNNMKLYQCYNCVDRRDRVLTI